jgi:branched-chain amino acid transport system ATP-binding protein
MSGPFLRVADLSMRFGGLLAVDGIAFDVRDREIFAIIGPNGAGKTTVFNCISGFYRPAPAHPPPGAGDWPDWAATRWHARRGAHLPERAPVQAHDGAGKPAGGPAPPPENLAAGRPVRTRAYRESEQKALDNALHWLDYMGLREFANREAGNLAYGHQRRLEIARCMVTQPRVLMLDEPAAGLNPQEKKDLQGLIEQLRNEYGVAVLLIEHDMSLVMGVSERILVMEHGRPIALGTPEAIRGDERVIKAYLGEE